MTIESANALLKIDKNKALEGILQGLYRQGEFYATNYQ